MDRSISRSIQPSYLFPKVRPLSSLLRRKQIPNRRFIRTHQFYKLQNQLCLPTLQAEIRQEQLQDYSYLRICNLPNIPHLMLRIWWLVHPSPATKLVDVRLRPVSRYGERYHWHRRLGNLHYKSRDLPIALAPGHEDAIAELAALILEGTSLVLLCACSDAQACHRTLVVRLVQDGLPVATSCWGVRAERPPSWPDPSP